MSDHEAYIEELDEAIEFRNYDKDKSQERMERLESMIVEQRGLLAKVRGRGAPKKKKGIETEIRNLQAQLVSTQKFYDDNQAKLDDLERHLERALSEQQMRSQAHRDLPGGIKRPRPVSSGSLSSLTDPPSSDDDHDDGDGAKELAMAINKSLAKPAKKKSRIVPLNDTAGPTKPGNATVSQGISPPEHLTATERTETLETDTGSVPEVSKDSTVPAPEGTTVGAPSSGPEAPKATLAKEIIAAAVGNLEANPGSEPGSTKENTIPVPEGTKATDVGPVDTPSQVQVPPAPVPKAAARPIAEPSKASHTSTSNADSVDTPSQVQVSPAPVPKAPAPPIAETSKAPHTSTSTSGAPGVSDPTPGQDQTASSTEAPKSGLNGDGEGETPVKGKEKHVDLDEPENPKKKNPTIQKFEDLPEEKQRELINSGMRSLRQFMSGDITSLPSTLIRKIRQMQAYLPEAATVNEDLARALFISNRNNRQCLYHQWQNKSYVFDGTEKGAMLIHGVPGSRKMSKRKDEKQDVQEGLLNCGCTEENALWELVWWKTWHVTCEVNGEEITEHLHSGLPDPRLRLFFIEALKKEGVEIADYYTQSIKKNPAEDRIQVLRRRIANLVHELNALHGFDAENEELGFFDVMYYSNETDVVTIGETESYPSRKRQGYFDVFPKEGNK